MQFVLQAIHELVKFVGLLLIGQFLVYVLSFGRHDQNPIYRFIRFLTSPVVGLVRKVTPAVVVDRHVPLVTFLVTFWVWVVLIFLRQDMMNGGVG